MFATFTCTCSEYQLDHVGCICGDLDAGEISVSVFKDGYASDNRAHFTCSARATDEQIGAYVRRSFGGFARAYNIKRPSPPVLAYPQALIREFSRDN